MGVIEKAWRAIAILSLLLVAISTLAGCGESVPPLPKLAPGDSVLDIYEPTIMLLCLGGNDMLRKVDPMVIEANLRRMIENAGRRGVAVLLVGVPKPALFGGTANFYERLADDFALPFEGQILNDILKDNAYKSDPIHPNARGYRVLAEALAGLLRRAGAV